MAKWKQVKIKDAFSLQMGKTPARDNNAYWELPMVAWASVSDITNCKYILETKEKISDIAIRETGIKLVPQNTVIMSFKLSIGKTAITSIPLYTNEAIMAFLPLNASLWNVSFLYYYLKNKVWNVGANKAVKGMTLNKESLGNNFVICPPMEEQEKIAKELDSVVELLEKQKQLLTEQDILIKSIFCDMFGDPVTNDKGWITKKLKDLGTLARGKSKHRPRNDSILLGGAYPLVQTGDIAQADLYLRQYSQTYSELGAAQSKIWKKGTLCITIAANIAKTAILNFDACFPDSIVGFINNDKCNIMFVQIWLTFLQKILEDNAPQAAQKNINMKILSNLDVPVPPLSLQQKFASLVEGIEAQKEKIKASISETQTLFNALMAKYFDEE